MKAFIACICFTLCLLTAHTKRTFTLKGCGDCSAEAGIVSAAIARDVELKTVGPGKYAVDFVIEVKQQLPMQTMAVANITYCSNEGDMNSCAPVYTKEVMDLCKRVNEKNTVWEPFVKSIQNFDKKCPVKKGIYTVKNYEPDIDEHIEVNDGLYRFTFEFSGPTGKLGCAYSEVIITMNQDSSEEEK